jgi:hypothetical protein
VSIWVDAHHRRRAVMDLLLFGIVACVYGLGARIVGAGFGRTIYAGIAVSSLLLAIAS